MGFEVLNQSAAREYHCQKIMDITLTKNHINKIVEKIVSNITESLTTRVELQCDRTINYTSINYCNQNVIIGGLKNADIYTLPTIISHYLRNSELGCEGQDALPADCKEFSKTCCHAIANRIEELVIERFKDIPEAKVESEIVFTGYLISDDSFSHDLVVTAGLIALIPLYGWIAAPLLLCNNLYDGSFYFKFNVTPILRQSTPAEGL